MDRTVRCRHLHSRPLTIRTLGALNVKQDSVDVGGGRLTYHYRKSSEGGAAQAVIFLHPWFGCWQFWQATADALPEFDVYSLDLYSLGDGPNWRDFAGPEGLAKAVGAFIDALGLERCVVVGNSMGGITAQVLAAERGKGIDKLILVGTGARIFGVKPEWRKALDTWIAGEADRAFTERLVAGLTARTPEKFPLYVEQVAAANKAFMGAVLNDAFEHDFRSLLPNITAKTLVIRGEFDAARTPAHVAELLAGIPDSRAVEVPNAGHSPQVDSHDRFTPLVRDFLVS